ncbi:hypothetical protein BX666DRAFT_2073641 [Dichotomocladium elegans]|nr:hypothetical protein BX666DRAFT_2073641 [Dichotomocladium elegans]
MKTAVLPNFSFKSWTSKISASCLLRPMLYFSTLFAFWRVWQCSECFIQFLFCIEYFPARNWEGCEPTPRTTWRIHSPLH